MTETEKVTTYRALVRERRNGGKVMSDGKPTLYAALVRAQAETKALSKEAYNEQHRYSYTSSEQIIEEARRSLGAAGIAVFAVSSSLTTEGRFAIGTSKQEVVGRVHCTFLVVHGESGEKETCTDSLAVVTNGGRPDDKAECAAKTMCLAYFLRTLLLIPRDDEAASIDARDDTSQFGGAEVDRILEQDRKKQAVLEELKGTPGRQQEGSDAWDGIMADWKERIRKARKASATGEIILEARAVAALPKDKLEEIERYAHEVDEKKRAASRKKDG